MTRTRDTALALFGAAGGFALGALVGNAVGSLASHTLERQSFEDEDGERIHINYRPDTAMAKDRRLIREAVRGSRAEARRSNNGSN